MSASLQGRRFSRLVGLRLRFASILFLTIFVGAAEAQISKASQADPSDLVARLLAPRDDKIDLVEAKLTIDRIVDPTTNTAATRRKLTEIATAIREMAGPNAKASDKIAAMRRYIYQPGPWNGGSTFAYDHDDPDGKVAAHKTLAYYLQTKRGNCITMPVLFLALAEKLGVEVTLTTAPRHLLIQFRDPDTGNSVNLEATSGANPQRVEWLRSQLPMTDKAIVSGMYLKHLTRKQMVAVLAETILQKLNQDGKDEERIQVAETMLEQYPQCDVALLNIYDASRRLLNERLLSRGVDIENLTPAEQIKFDRWLEKGLAAADKVRELGFQAIGTAG